jgi:predicted PurR-regulated permease PerM
MILQGFIGLFIGAVALALFYQLLTEWLREGEGTPPTEPSTEAAKS